MTFDGMWAEPDSDPREVLEPGRGEKAVLAEYLDRYPMTFELKCARRRSRRRSVGHLAR